MAKQSVADVVAREKADAGALTETLAETDVLNFFDDPDVPALSAESLSENLPNPQPVTIDMGEPMGRVKLGIRRLTSMEIYISTGMLPVANRLTELRGKENKTQADQEEIATQQLHLERVAICQTCVDLERETALFKMPGDSGTHYPVEHLSDTTVHLLYTAYLQVNDPPKARQFFRAVFRAESNRDGAGDSDENRPDGA